ncbi:RNA-directed DNA polymerase [bacterium]|nr:RNA-directed DNA polymerase [bacterium]
MSRNKHKNRAKIKLKPDFTIEDLYRAFYECRKGKRNSQSELEFEFDLESNMRKLYDDLKSGNYKIGKSICFVVLKPKPREVWAATFRDRIVHHLIYNAIKDRFYSTFIKDTYSCIPKRGTLSAARQVEKYARAITKDYTREAYYLKADLKNFFVSIDKNILYELVKEKVPEQWILNLVHQIIFHNPQRSVIIQSPGWKFDKLPYYKSLWNTPTCKGLPIGNLTSQFFSNIYLNSLDQYIKHKLNCKYYCRYVDDFVIMDVSPSRLNYLWLKISDYILSNRMINLHKDKRTVNFVRNGIDFVGYVIKPNRFFLRKCVIKRIFSIVKRFADSVYTLENGAIKKFKPVFTSYIGMLGNTSGFLLKILLTEQASFPFIYI